jgi:hypothetical protein
MLMQELEAQCMNLSQIVDTEIVEGDPREISSFDASTLYVWVVPGPRSIRKASASDTHSPNIYMLRGRLGERDETATSVPELAKKLGVPSS